MIRIAVCDDKPEELNRISYNLNLNQPTNHLHMGIHDFSSGFSLLDALDSGERFDIIILDIIMPGENGMDIAREIRKNHTEIEIIFLTSSPEYAVESYEVNANN